MLKKIIKKSKEIGYTYPLIMVSTVTFLFLTLACDFKGSNAIEEGNVAFDREQYSEALNAYSRARSKSGHAPEATYNSANVYYRQEDYPAAKTGYEEVLLKSEGRLAQDDRFNLGNTLYKLDNLTLAIESYKDLLRTNYQDMDSKFNLEIALLRLQQLEAEQDQQDESNPDSQQNLTNSNPSTLSTALPSTELPENALDDSYNGQESDQDRPGELETQQSDQLDMEPKTELSEEQAIQILEMIGKQTDSLQSHLGNKLAPAGNPAIRDW